MSSTHNHCFSHHHYQAWCHQIFFVNNTKIFVTPSVFKLQKWFLHQNGVESNQESKSDDSGPFYNVTERCEAVREVPKDVLKMASGLISPSGHRGQLCIDIFRCEASLLVGVSVRTSRQVLKSYII